ncbi:hypothetical protein Fcan01_19161 [Folsomia candida]|uniref:Uncharacterized protein n=1 Tax=Folsomia candida TaxID=158441 RepID=A0A226DN07_FOLCA|nr:hypothetical protein Fcan01_19161 [Folsomia candida]
MDAELFLLGVQHRFTWFVKTTQVILPYVEGHQFFFGPSPQHEWNPPDDLCPKICPLMDVEKARFRISCHNERHWIKRSSISIEWLLCRKIFLGEVHTCAPPNLNFFVNKLPGFSMYLNGVEIGLSDPAVKMLVGDLFHTEVSLQRPLIRQSPARWWQVCRGRNAPCQNDITEFTYVYRYQMRCIPSNFDPPCRITQVPEPTPLHETYPALQNSLVKRFSSALTLAKSQVFGGALSSKKRPLLFQKRPLQLFILTPRFFPTGGPSSFGVPAYTAPFIVVFPAINFIRRGPLVSLKMVIINFWSDFCTFQFTGGGNPSCFH